MKDIEIGLLFEEVERLGSILLATKVYHPCGVRLHSSTEVIAPEHLKLMEKLGFTKVRFLDPGEPEPRMKEEKGDSGEGEATRVDMSDLEDGDVLEENVPGTKYKKGAVVDSFMRVVLREAGLRTVLVRRESVEASRAQAEKYLEMKPPPPKNPYRIDTRIERATALRSALVRPYYMARNRCVICTDNDFMRSALAGTLASAGHEVKAVDDPRTLAKEASKYRANIVIVDQPAIDRDILSALKDVRRKFGDDRMGIVVCADPEMKSEEGEVLKASGNEWLVKPVGTQIMLDRVRACAETMGRRAKVRPKPQQEKRGVRRAEGYFTATLKDAFAMKPLPLPTAQVVDFSEKGICVTYDMPEWPVKWAYRPGGVHPSHPHFKFARSNPMGQELVVGLAPPDSDPIDVYVKIVHLYSAGDAEVVGMSFQNVSRDLEGRLVTLRGKRGG